MIGELHHIRVLTYNTWHALDHRHPKLMFPLQSPTRLAARALRQGRALRSLLSSDPRVLDLLLLQELNPVGARTAALRAQLGLKGRSRVVNAGVRLGAWGWPPFMNEGLAVLHSSNLRDTRWFGGFLSGEYSGVRGPLGLGASLQLAESRSYFGVSGSYGGFRVLAVNVHLHHLFRERGQARRSEEVARLASELEPRLKRADLAFVGGDFNCEPEAAEMRPLLELGFECADAPLSWDPRTNSLQQEFEEPDPEARTPMRLDRVYHWRRRGEGGPSEPRENVRRVLDAEPVLSDHYGTLAEYRF
jgi:endonuclease/exonuclease/phosphatase family metal-dependent hydrolase